MSVDHGTAYRQSYRDTPKDRARLEADLRRQRQRTAATLASLVVDVREGKRRMNSRLLEEVGAASRRLAEIDEMLWTPREPASEPPAASPA
jgi:hypothetical protein